MLCQGARGLTQQGTRALILARFSISPLLIFYEFLDLNPCVRCASSAAINKLDVIMPPIEDFPARHIGKLTGERVTLSMCPHSPGPRKHDVRNMLKQVTHHLPYHLTRL